MKIFLNFIIGRFFKQNLQKLKKITRVENLLIFAGTFYFNDIKKYAVLLPSLLKLGFYLSFTYISFYLLKIITTGFNICERKEYKVPQTQVPPCIP